MFASAKHKNRSDRLKYFRKLSVQNIFGVFLLLILLAGCFYPDKAHFANFGTFESPYNTTSLHFTVQIKFLDGYTGDSPPPFEKADSILIERIEDSTLPVKDNNFIEFRIEGTDFQGIVQIGKEVPIDRSSISDEQIHSWQDDNEVLTLILDIGEEFQEEINITFLGNSMSNY